MIKMVRERLDLTQEQMAWYLRLSNSMIKKIELGKRWTPFACMDAVARLFKIILDTREDGSVDTPPSAAGHYARQMKRKHRQCQWRLQRYQWALADMQRSRAEECFRLEVYQRLARSVTPPQSKDDQDCLKWAQWAIENSLHRLKATDPAAQDFLIAEIAGLQSKIAALEGTALFQSLTPPPRQF